MPQSGLLKHIVDASPDGILVVDLSGRITFSNARANTLFGYTPAEIIGMSVDDLVPEAFRAEHSAHRARYHAEASARAMGVSKLLTALRKDGIEIPVDVALNSMDTPEGVRMLAVVRDTTERRALQEALSRASRAYRALSECNQALVHAQDVDGLLQSVCRTLVNVGGYRLAWVGFVEEDEASTVRPVAHAGFSDGYLDRLNVTWADSPRGRGPVGTAIRSGQPCAARHVLTDERFEPWREDALQRGYASVLSLPLLDDGTVRGAVTVYAEDTDAFDMKETQLLAELADDLVYGMRLLRLQDERERALAAEHEQRMFAEAMRDVVTAVSGTMSLGAIAQHAIGNLWRVVTHDAAQIMLVEDGVAQPLSWHGFEERGLEAEIAALRLPLATTPLLAEMRETRQPCLLPDVNGDARWTTQAASWWVGSYLGAPLEIGGEDFGFLCVMSEQSGAFDADDHERLEVFAGQISLALKNARLYDALEKHRDELESAVEDATRQLRQSKERVEAILHNSPDPILLLTPGGVVETASPAFDRLFGGATGAVVGRRFDSLVAPEHVENAGEYLRMVEAARQPQRFECRARRPAGCSIELAVALAPVIEDEALVGIVCSMQDISAFKEVDRAKNEFLSNAAHELRTPLTSIRGFSEVLLNRELPAERATHYLSLIHEQSVQLAGILDDLLNLASLDSEEAGALERTSVDIGRLVRSGVRPFAEGSPRHTFRVVADDALPPVYADPARLAQVVRNLLSNAVKYSPDGGGVTVTVRCDGDYVQVSVADEGIGISAEEQRHLFERFYRAAPRHPTIHGTGLGLSICRSIVGLHGGRIWVVSEPGSGSVFSFTVPVLAEAG